MNIDSLIQNYLSAIKSKSTSINPTNYKSTTQSVKPVTTTVVPNNNENIHAGPTGLPKSAPAGYTVLKHITQAVAAKAKSLLSGDFGTTTPFEIDGISYLARVEPHFHPIGYKNGPNGWHKGVTVYQKVGDKALSSINNNSTNNNSTALNQKAEPPVKVSFQNSGDFSTVSPNKFHPNGHMGVDIRVPGGTSIYPILPGIVSDVGSSPKGGNTVHITHDGGLISYYAHMSTVLVHKGDKVDQNISLGTVGNSGNAQHSMPHIHLEIKKNGAPQNPANYFNVPKFTDFNPKKEQAWLSPEAQQQAKQFDMNKHLQQKSSLGILINNFISLAVKKIKHTKLQQLKMQLDDAKRSGDSDWIKELKEEIKIEENKNSQ